MSPTAPPPMLILGASGRAAAFSARRAGFEPFVADRYGDVDLAVCRRSMRVARYPNGLEAAAREFPGDVPWMYTGALENRPALVDRIAAQRPLYGNPGHVLRRVRDPFQVADVLRERGLCVPAVQATPPAAEAGTWLRKPLRSAGGEGLQILKPDATTAGGSSHCYYQQYIAGRTCSAVYVAAGGRAVWLGVTRQLIGARWTGATGFQYAGSVGPLPVAEQAARDWEAIGAALATTFELVGLFGVDAIVAKDRVWPVEINPRYPASVEVLERGLGLQALALHVRACQSGELPTGRRHRRERASGKAILYAPHPVTIAAGVTQALLATNGTGPWPVVADIPAAGTVIGPRQPVLTLLAEGPSLATVEHRLRTEAGRVQELLGFEAPGLADSIVGMDNPGVAGFSAMSGLATMHGLGQRVCPGPQQPMASKGENMVEARVLQIVRQFWENAIKLLLENPKNVRDLLTLVGGDLVKRIDLRRVKLIPTTFVERDYRHVESDIVLLAPLRRRKGERTPKVLMIYILIEHQSEPDRLMPLRTVDYVVQIYKYQVREWSKTHRSLARIRLYPVLPVVFYTGTRRWDSVGRLVDLLVMGQAFAAVTPALDPLFINLPVIPAATLEEQGGFFGWVLRLIQQRNSRPREFQQLLNRVVQHLETMPKAERRRWLELLSYIVALVYHAREPTEWPSLQETIEASVQTDEHRQEVFEMRRTIADELEERGGIKTRQQTLVRLLKRRFGDLPDELSSTIRATDDPQQLDGWLDQVVTAETLEEVGIEVPA